jgi:molybdopterin/thiamine biosynthesis adenylyltransferase
LKAADVLFGCVDSHGSRLLLNAFAVQYMLPYIDVGVGIGADTNGKLTESGGQYRIVMPGGFCLECVRAINPIAASNDLLSPDQRKVHQERGYIPSEDIPAPSVVFLNGALASLAVGEFLNMLTGYRPPQRLTYYFLHDQTMRTVDVSDRRPDCPTCIPTGRMAQGDIEPVLGLPGQISLNLSTIPKPSDGRPDPAQQPGG